MSEEIKRDMPSKSQVNAKKRGRPAKPKPKPVEGVADVADVAAPKADGPNKTSDGGVKLNLSGIKCGKRGVHVCDSRPDGSTWGAKVFPHNIGVFYEKRTIDTLLKMGAKVNPGPTNAKIDEDRQIDWKLQHAPQA